MTRLCKRVHSGCIHAAGRHEGARYMEWAHTLHNLFG